MLVYVESSAPMAREIPNPYALDEIAKRLRLLRQAIGTTQASMASLAGVTPQAWGNYEQGLRRIEIDAVTRLRASLGVTSEWVYYGTIGLMPLELVEKIQLAKRELERKSPRLRA